MLASQLKLEVLPDKIWNKLVKTGHVEIAQDSDYEKAREYLLIEARDLVGIYRDGSSSTTVSKKQRSGKRQRASARSRLEAEIAAKIGKARTKKSRTATSNGDEVNLRRLPVAGSISNNQITVTAEPWVSPEEVRREYKSLQDVWFWKPTPSERRVQVLRFVARFCEGWSDEKRDIVGLVPGTSWPGWRQIMERWNQRYPQDHDWHYKDVRNFERDARETFDALTRFKDF